MKSSRGAPVKKNAHLHLVESTHQRLLVLYTCVLGRLINCALDYEGRLSQDGEFTASSLSLFQTNPI